MTVYRIKYQTRRKSTISILQGDWLDKESIVVAGDDATEAVNETKDSLVGVEFRLTGVEIVTGVDIVSHSIEINPIGQEYQNTIE